MRLFIHPLRKLSNTYSFLLSSPSHYSDDLTQDKILSSCQSENSPKRSSPHYESSAGNDPNSLLKRTPAHISSFKIFYFLSHLTLVLLNPPEFCGNAAFPVGCLSQDQQSYVCCSVGCGPIGPDGKTPLCRGSALVPTPSPYDPPAVYPPGPPTDQGKTNPWTQSPKPFGHNRLNSGFKFLVLRNFWYPLNDCPLQAVGTFNLERVLVWA